MDRPTLTRLLIWVIVGAVLLWVLAVLAFSALLADPTSGSGEGRFPGTTVTGPVP